MSAMLGFGTSPLVFVLVYLTIVAILLLGAVMESRRQGSPDAQACWKVGETRTPGTGLGMPTLTVQVLGNPGRVTYGDATLDCTRLSLRVRRCCGGTLNIESRRRGGEALNHFGSTPVATGDADFDADFVVHAAPQKYARWFFAPSRRSEVVSTIRRLSLHGGVAIRISVGEVDIKVGHQLTQDGGLAFLLNAGQELVRVVTTTRLPGEPAALAGICPVCATPLSEPAWVCDRCRVPQHRQCRDYFGRCAIFGCEPQPRRRAA